MKKTKHPCYFIRVFLPAFIPSIFKVPKAALMVAQDIFHQLRFEVEHKLLVGTISTTGSRKKYKSDNYICRLLTLYMNKHSAILNIT